MKIILDTNICIYLIKNNPPEVRGHFLRYEAGDIGITSISVAELYYGVYKSAAKEKNHNALLNFLLPLKIVNFDIEAAKAYGKIRYDLEKAGTPIGVMDMLIAAIAISLDTTLITHNLKEFRRVKRLHCETWLI